MKKMILVLFVLINLVFGQVLKTNINKNLYQFETKELYKDIGAGSFTNLTDRNGNCKITFTEFEKSRGDRSRAYTITRAFTAEENLKPIQIHDLNCQIIEPKEEDGFYHLKYSFVVVKKLSKAETDTLFSIKIFKGEKFIKLGELFTFEELDKAYPNFQTTFKVEIYMKDGKIVEKAEPKLFSSLIGLPDLEKQLLNLSLKQDEYILGVEFIRENKNGDVILTREMKYPMQFVKYDEEKSDKYYERVRGYFYFAQFDIPFKIYNEDKQKKILENNLFKSEVNRFTIGVIPENIDGKYKFHFFISNEDINLADGGGGGYKYSQTVEVNKGEKFKIKLKDKHTSQSINLKDGTLEFDSLKDIYAYINEYLIFHFEKVKK